MRKLFKNEIGITLVALIVTIIILLILAGVSIAALTESGLFEKARLAKQKAENAQIEEEAILADYENQITSTRDTKNQSNYSTNEQVVGTWIDGKKLYEKTVVIKDKEIKQGTEIPHGIENLEYAFVTQATIINTNGKIIQMPNSSIVTGYVGINLTWIDSVNFTFRGYDALPVANYNSMYVTVRYTKTTD